MADATPLPSTTVLPPEAATANGQRIDPAAPRPARQPKGLTHGLVGALGEQIRRQAIRPGDKLPSEAEIMQTYGVSRSVVREALSQLQAAGLVETHHGIGTFALESRRDGAFSVGRLAVGGLEDVLEALELRAGFESEAAGLAALRRTDEQLGELRRALQEFESHMAVAGDTVSPDFRFHLTIAQSTGNRYFADLMSQLGLAVIPRTRLSSAALDLNARLRHLQRVNQEHQDIYDAIARRDAEFARAAMRIHLLNSRERQRRADPAPLSRG